MKETPTSGQEATTDQEEEKDDYFDPDSAKEGRSEPELSALEHFLPLLRFLDEHQDQLEELLGSSRPPIRSHTTNFPAE